MNQEQLIKDIVFVGTHWGSSKERDRRKVNDVLAYLKEKFPCCQHCNEGVSDNKFWIIEEVRKGFIIKKYETNVFLVCSLKCLLDRGLNRDAYYSVVVQLANGEVLSTGFRGLNVVALNEFATEINRDAK
ncbi:hypothetical protein JCM14036_12720 [Desulfotomaculum defluvii]